MSDCQTVWLTRHGNRIDFVDPDWTLSADRPFDPHLTRDGLEQARALALRLAGEGIRRIFASPFLRTLQTAEEVAKVIEAPIGVEHGAAEWLHPDWFTETPDFPQPERETERFPHVDPSYKSRLRPQFPETWPEHVERCTRALQLLIDEYGSDFLVVGHAASVMAMARGLVGDARLDVGVGLCSVTRLARRDGKWRLELNGETSHLAGIDAAG